MEGQSVSHGMLASPGAISDLAVNSDGCWDNYVLSDDLKPELSATVNPMTGKTRHVSYLAAKGITGTGVVATVALGIESGLIKLPEINTPDHILHFQDGISFTEHDLQEAGKAMGAIRAGHKALIEEVGIDDAEIKTMYLAGASGTYVDPIKAQAVGMIPRVIEKTVQVGNTSLMMARDLVCDDETLDIMQSVADSIASKHIMFASSKKFCSLYLNELAYWTQGMTLEGYNEMLESYGMRPLPTIVRPREMKRIVNSDIPEVGNSGLKILNDVGVYLHGSFDGCTGCRTCEQQCPERALNILDEGAAPEIRIATEYCLGTACKRCEQSCPKKVYRFNELKIAGGN